MSTFQLIELGAVVASGAFGALLARRKQLDFVGVFSIAFIVAFGGGTLRDLFLDRHPLFWIKHEHYVMIVFGISIAMSVVPSLPKRMESILNLPDALGLGLFSAVGAEYALEAGCSIFLATLFGVITGTFGGVIGEVVCNEIPSLFRAAPLYATCSFVGSLVFLLLGHCGVAEPIPVCAGIFVTVALRLGALRWNWRLPQHV